MLAGENDPFSPAGVLVSIHAGTLQFCGVHINAVTYVLIVIAIGLLVDFLVSNTTGDWRHALAWPGYPTALKIALRFCRCTYSFDTMNLDLIRVERTESKRLYKPWGFPS